MLARERFRTGASLHADAVRRVEPDYGSIAFMLRHSRNKANAIAANWPKTVAKIAAQAASAGEGMAGDALRERASAAQAEWDFWKGRLL